MSALAERASSRATMDFFDELPDTAGVRSSVVCRLLDCSPTTVWRLSKQGALETVRIGPRHTVYTVGSVRRLLGASEK